MEKRMDGRIWFLVIGLLLVPVKLDNGLYPMCQKLEVPLCNHMPYNMTNTPNLMHHPTQQDAIIGMEPYEALIWTRCSVYLDFFLCSLFAPICTLQFNAEGIPPCQDVCHKVHRNCNHIMRRMNATWSHHFNCSNFPVINKGVCVSPEAIMEEYEEDPEVKRKRLRDACKCKHMPRLKYKLYAQRKFDYVVEADIRDTQSWGELTQTSIHVRETFKRGHVHLISNMEAVLWTNRSCTCPPIFANREYLILGYEDAKGNKLLFTEDSMAIPWRRKYTRTIKRWNKKLYPERKEAIHDEELNPHKVITRRRNKGRRRNNRKGRAKWRLNQPAMVRKAIQKASHDHHKANSMDF